MALLPSKLSDFRIVAPLGSGATARVFDAVHVASQRAVAIKMLAPREEEAVGELRERFAREAIALSQLSSRHTARIVGFGFELGQPFLVLERLQGETIDGRIKRTGPIPAQQLGPWIAQLLVGVRDCHAHEVIHRDIKPANIFLQNTAGDPVVKLIDFGVARLSALAQGGVSLTSTQHLLGSVGYMAPEQFESGKAVGPLTDLYAVAVVVFRCITGRLPFSGASLDRVIQAKIHEDPVLISSMPGAPMFGALDWFVAKGMARDPSARFQSAREMLDAWHDVMPLLGSPNIAVQTSAPPPEIEEPAPLATHPPRTPAMHPPTIPPASITAENSIVQDVRSTELVFVDSQAEGRGEAEPDAASTSENRVVEFDAAPPTRFDNTDELPSVDAPHFSSTAEQFARGPASIPRTVRRGAMAAPVPRRVDDESTKTYPHLRQLVDKELELSRDRLKDDVAPPTTQHTGPRDDDPPPSG